MARRWSSFLRNIFFASKNAPEEQQKLINHQNIAEVIHYSTIRDVAQQ